VARRPSTRPWTRLLVALGVTVVAFAAIIAGGWSPRLGLDLAGGTTVTLQPKTLQEGKRPPEKALDQAVSIIRQRVNGLGVSEAEVVKQSPYLVVSVPGSSRKNVLDTVGRTAQLSFREVADCGGQACVEQDTSVRPLTPVPSASVGATPQVLPSGTAPASSAPASSAPASSAPASSAPASSATPTGAASPQGRPAVDPTSAAPVPTSAAPSASAAAPAPPSPPAPASAPASAPAVAPASAPAPAIPLPPGTGALTFTEAQARAAFGTFACGDAAQARRAADFTADSWALGCGRKGNPVKYLLKPAGAKGTDVGGATAQPQTTNGGQVQVTTGQWVVEVSFKNDAFGNLSKITAGGVKRTAITLDGIVESDPVNQQALDRQVEISGNFSQQEASDLATTLQYGSLPLSFSDNATSQTVSPTLGRSSLNAGLLAGAIGMAIVIVYCLFYYRALAIVTVLSLGASGAMVYAATVLLGQSIGFTLSLAGIAGFIIGVGVTADSFVVYYERIKDEVRMGRTVRSAVTAAWAPARRTTISADVVALLAAVILYLVSVGSVRGFALTLGLTTALDLVVFFLVTRPLVELLTQRPFFSSGRFSGLKASGLQAPIRRRPVARRPGAPLGATTIATSTATPTEA